MQCSNSFTCTATTSYLNAPLIVAINQNSLAWMQENLPSFEITIEILFQLVLAGYLNEVALIVSTVRGISVSIFAFFNLCYHLLNVLFVQQVEQMLKDISRKVLLIAVKLIKILNGLYKSQ